jgi:hypothetical protein
MGKMNMPIAAEKAANQTNPTPSKGVSKLFSPLPDAAKQKHNNGVLIPTFYPAKWKIFNPTVNDVAKFNMASKAGSSDPTSTLSVPYDLCSFYFKVPVHSVSNYSRPDGSVGFANTVCPIHFNKYLTEVLGFEPLFNSPIRCAFCEEEQAWWNKFNARLEELGHTKETRKNLSKDGYNDLVNKDSVLKNAREKARKLQASDKYVLPIMDYDQIAGVKPMREGQETIEHQMWLAPGKVFDKLATLCEMSPDGQEFYNMENTAGVQVLYIVKDTERCSQGNMMLTQYDVVAAPGRVVLDPSWLAYVQNVDAMVDPSDFLNLITYEEQRYYLGQAAAQASTPVTTPATPPVARPPVAAPAPPAAPVAPPVAATAPVAPPMPAASAAPPMPAPAPVAASPVPAQAPAAPVPASPIPIVPQAQGHKPPPGAPPKGKRAW